MVVADDPPGPRRQLPLSRLLIPPTSLNLYYAIGNTLPVDFLEHSEAIYKTSSPDDRDEGDGAVKVVVLGMGDLRSVLYTIWKLAVNVKSGIVRSSVLSGRKRLQFYLNDIEPAIMARNALFVYFTIVFGQMNSAEQDQDRRRRFLCAVWSVFYCMELLPGHVGVLRQALQDLLGVTKPAGAFKDWSRSDPAQKDGLNLWKSKVSFESEVVLEVITSQWSRWLDWLDKQYPSRAQMQSERSRFQSMNLRSFGLSYNERLKRPCDIKHMINVNQWLFGMRAERCEQQGGKLTEKAQLHRGNQIESEYYDYIFGDGCSFAEQVFGIAIVVGSKQPTTARTVNPTLYSRGDDYLLYNLSAPFDGYHLAPQSTRADDRWGLADQHDGMVVPDESFVDKPALANSVQQFSRWFVEASRMLVGPRPTGESKTDTSGSIEVTFLISSGDCCLFLKRLQVVDQIDSAVSSSNGNILPSSSVDSGCFDAVYTSNLMDYVPFPDLLGLSAQLLGESGVFECSSMLHYGTNQDVNQFLEKRAGMPVELFPVVFGIQPIGYHGKYSDPKFWPYSSGKHTGKYLFPEDSINGWCGSQNLLTVAFKPVARDCLPFHVNDWTHQDGLCRFLAEFCKTNIMSYMASNKIGLGTRSVGSWFVTLQCFAARMVRSGQFGSKGGGGLESGAFWQPLVDAIKLVVPVYFQEELQAQAFLHGFHWHVTLAENDCSMCDPTKKSSIIAVDMALAGSAIEGALYSGNWGGWVILNDAPYMAEKNRNVMMSRLNGKEPSVAAVRKAGRYHAFLMIDMVSPEGVGMASRTPNPVARPYYPTSDKDCRRIRFFVRRNALSGRSFAQFMGAVPYPSIDGVPRYELMMIAEMKCKEMTLLEPKNSYYDCSHASVSRGQIDQIDPLPPSFGSVPLIDNVRLVDCRYKSCQWSDDANNSVGDPNMLDMLAVVRLEVSRRRQVGKTPIPTASMAVKLVHQPSSNLIRISAGSAGSLDLKFPFPVDADRCVIAAEMGPTEQEVGSAEVITITVPRIVTSNVNCPITKKMGFVSPDNTALLVPVGPDCWWAVGAGFPIHGKLMFRATELPSEHHYSSIALRVATHFKGLFDHCLSHQYYGMKYFDESTGSYQMLAAGFVLSSRYDIERQSPAIDFLFCVFPRKWRNHADDWRANLEQILVEASGQRALMVRRADMVMQGWAEFQLFLNWIDFFAGRTVINREVEPLLPQIMARRNIRQHFQRAVIYPVYADPEHILSEASRDEFSKDTETMGFNEKSPEKLCNVCNRGGQLQRCGSCKEVHYCSKVCQNSDWARHKPDCKRKPR